jgi:hypothetical protein
VRRGQAKVGSAPRRARSSAALTRRSPLGAAASRADEADGIQWWSESGGPPVDLGQQLADPGQQARTSGSSRATHCAVTMISRHDPKVRNRVVPPSNVSHTSKPSPPASSPAVTGTEAVADRVDHRPEEDGLAEGGEAPDLLPVGPPLLGLRLDLPGGASIRALLL